MTKIEEVARAIELELDKVEAVLADPVTLRRLKAKRIARAAIAAMREPTDAMFAAAIRATGEQANWVDGYMSMIDEMLAEDGE